MKSKNSPLLSALAFAVLLVSSVNAANNEASSLLKSLQAIKDIQNKQNKPSGVQNGSLLPPPPLPSAGLGMAPLPSLTESPIASAVKQAKMFDEDITNNAKSGVEREKSIPRAIGFSSYGNERYAYVAFEGKVFKLSEGSLFGNFKLDKIFLDHMIVSMYAGTKKVKTFTSYADISGPRVEQSAPVVAAK